MRYTTSYVLHTLQALDLRASIMKHYALLWKDRLGRAMNELFCDESAQLYCCLLNYCFFFIIEILDN